MSNKNSNNTKDSAKEKVAEMKTPSIEEIQKALDIQIENFQHKSELIENRNRFLFNKQKLSEYLSEQGTDFEDSLDSEHLKVVLSDNRHYRGDKSISISNNLLVREFVEFLIVKIDTKVSQIEKEILG